MKYPTHKSIVLFDGVCNLCNGTVNFIIKHDSKVHFLFASLQSDVAKEILLQFPEKKINLDSILLIEKGELYENSSASIRIFKHLNYGYKLGYILIIVPAFIRDFFYRIIANNRYRWFGKRTHFIKPTPEIKARFLS